MLMNMHTYSKYKHTPVGLSAVCDDSQPSINADYRTACSNSVSLHTARKYLLTNLLTYLLTEVTLTYRVYLTIELIEWSDIDFNIAADKLFWACFANLHRGCLIAASIVLRMVPVSINMEWLRFELWCNILDRVVYWRTDTECQTSTWLSKSATCMQ